MLTFRRIRLNQVVLYYNAKALICYGNKKLIIGNINTRYFYGENVILKERYNLYYLKCDFDIVIQWK